MSVFNNGMMLWWTMVNILTIVAIMVGFAVIVIALWRMMKAQERLADSLKELTSTLKSPEQKN